ncbi:uncharacterized protein DNG_08622 [Cephalotrichum gorgonifer]|uniref:Uncharacterized protein n=1 Tax=Cephalotrichum gorgonifer TaxID=2041049 RepID=A0AAE8N6B9_9PEZI|nr:uncharacterized protein DNG_08622 [Cephalotrichum gorgonifer]
MIRVKSEPEEYPRLSTARIRLSHQAAGKPNLRFKSSNLAGPYEDGLADHLPLSKLATPTFRYAFKMRGDPQARCVLGSKKGRTLGTDPASKGLVVTYLTVLVPFSNVDGPVTCPKAAVQDSPRVSDRREY